MQLQITDQLWRFVSRRTRHVQHHQQLKLHRSFVQYTQTFLLIDVDVLIVLQRKTNRPTVVSYVRGCCAVVKVGLGTRRRERDVAAVKWGGIRAGKNLGF